MNQVNLFNGVNVISLLRIGKMFTNSKLESMGSILMDRSSQFTDPNAADPKIFNVAVKIPEATLKLTAKMKYVSRLQDVAEEFYDVNCGLENLYRMLSFKRQAFEIDGEFTDVMFSPFGFASQNISRYPLENCSIGKLFALSPSTGNKQPRAIYVVFSAYLAQSDLLRLRTPENLFMVCWMGHFPLEWGLPSYCFQYPGETVFISPGCCYFRIVMAGGNNFAFGGGLDIYPCLCKLNVTVFLKVFFMFGWALRTVLFLKLSVCKSNYQCCLKLHSSVHFEELRPSRIDEHQKIVVF